MYGVRSSIVTGLADTRVDLAVPLLLAEHAHDYRRTRGNTEGRPTDRLRAKQAITAVCVREEFDWDLSRARERGELQCSIRKRLFSSF